VGDLAITKYKKLILAETYIDIQIGMYYTVFNSDKRVARLQPKNQHSQNGKTNTNKKKRSF